MEIFFCYSHKDEEFLNKLKAQLKSLQRQGLIDDIWHDRDINAGTLWEREIDTHLNQADIILLLISPDFMESEYCYSVEMKRALERQERGEVRVIPILLRPVYWQDAPFAKLQMLPKDAKSVIDWPNQDVALHNVADGIRKSIHEMSKRRLHDSQTRPLRENSKEKTPHSESVLPQEKPNEPHIKHPQTYRKRRYQYIFVGLTVPIIVFLILLSWFVTQQTGDQQRETQITSYLANMSTLVRDPNFRGVNPAGSNLRIDARAQTLTVLRELGQDGVRKAVVLKFLHDADLINRASFPIVSLAGADLSWTALRGIDLGGVDLVAADLTSADLTSADLIEADLSQAKLNGANLTGAKLDYTSLTGADLSCAEPNDPKTCTNLTGADLGGADLTGANLNGVIFHQTDISGTNLPNMLTRPLSNGSAFSTTWKVIREDTNTLLVAYNKGSLLPPYARLDLNTSKLQLKYGPLGNWGTSVVLLPALWSRTSCPTDYCETAPITGYSFSRSALSQDTFPISVSGTIAGLLVKVSVTFSKPMDYSISVAINAQVSSTNPVELDQTVFGTIRQSDAFKPVLLRAMHNSPSQWTAQEDILGSQRPSQLPENTRTLLTNVSTFGLVGGTSSFVTNAPNITVILNDLKSAGNDLKAAVSLEVWSGSDSSVDNVSMGAGVDSLLDTWSYTVIASMP